MDIEYKKGFHVHSVNMYLMEAMKKIRVTVAIYQTKEGIVMRKNDIPIALEDEDRTQKILLGDVDASINDRDTLYELPCFEDNKLDAFSGYTVLVKSDITKEHLNTLFEKL